MLIFFFFFFFFFNDTATTEIYTLSLHDALRICTVSSSRSQAFNSSAASATSAISAVASSPLLRSEEHTSELQSHSDLVCRLLLEKKKKKNITVLPLIKKKEKKIRQY